MAQKSINPGSAPILWSDVASAYNNINDNFTELYASIGGDLVDFTDLGTSLIPRETELYDLGSETKKWKDLWLSGSSIYIGNAVISSTGETVDLPAGSTIGGLLVDENYFKFVAVDGQSTIEADEGTDTLTVASGNSGISISTDAATDTLTISNTGVISLIGTAGQIGVSSATGSIVLSNLGVTRLTAGPGISVDQATGNVTIANIGLAGIDAGSGITISPRDPVTGSVTITNSQPNISQNTFSTIQVVGETAIAADSPADTLIFSAGSGISITTDPITDTITLATTNTFNQDLNTTDQVTFNRVTTTTIAGTNIEIDSSSKIWTFQTNGWLVSPADNDMRLVIGTDASEAVIYGISDDPDNYDSSVNISGFKFNTGSAGIERRGIFDSSANGFLLYTLGAWEVEVGGAITLDAGRNLGGAGDDIRIMAGVGTTDDPFEFSGVGRNGGDVILLGGDAEIAPGAGGDVILLGGGGTSSINGGNITLQGGAGGGEIYLRTGAGYINTLTWNRAGELVFPDGSKQITAYTGGSVGGGGGSFELNVAADDSTIRTIVSGETLQFEGANGLATTSDGEGKITIGFASGGNISMGTTGTIEIFGASSSQVYIGGGTGGGTSGNVNLGNGVNTIVFNSSTTGISYNDLDNLPNNGLQSRTTASGTTSSIADAATENITISGFKGYFLYKIQTSAAAWVRLYSDSASRTADSGRSSSTDPSPGSGVIAEVITSGSETILISPGTIGFNNESPVTTDIPVAVTNLSGGTTTVTVTLTIVQSEA